MNNTVATVCRTLRCSGKAKRAALVEKLEPFLILNWPINPFNGLKFLTNFKKEV